MTTTSNPHVSSPPPPAAGWWLASDGRWYPPAQPDPARRPSGAQPLGSAAIRTFYWGAKGDGAYWAQGPTAAWISPTYTGLAVGMFTAQSNQRKAARNLNKERKAAAKATPRWIAEGSGDLRIHPTGFEIALSNGPCFIAWNTLTEFLVHSDPSKGVVISWVGLTTHLRVEGAHDRMAQLVEAARRQVPHLVGMWVPSPIAHPLARVALFGQFHGGGLFILMINLLSCLVLYPVFAIRSALQAMRVHVECLRHPDSFQVCWRVLACYGSVILGIPIWFGFLAGL